jgi:histidyl-tRNA synthetase
VSSEPGNFYFAATLNFESIWKLCHLSIYLLDQKGFSMTFTAPPGVFDIIPQNPKDPWKSAYLWNYIERVIRDLASEYGLQEIRTPLFEKTELLKRGIGEGTDIVTKEMYTFEDKGGRSMTLRPEGTAPVIRAFLENQMHQQAGLQRLYYLGPMFRYERTQAGRFRQHHQFGAEMIGGEAPELDAEMIDIPFTVFQRLGLKDLKVFINSVGNAEARARFRGDLKKYLSTYVKELSSDSQARLEKNPLRILDSKDPQDQKIVASAPSILDYLDEASKTHFAQVQECLKDLGIPFEVNPLLVRGLDYYNKTVFEITSSNLGAQNSLAGGGRYDGLIRDLGGPDLPCLGFGSGLERVLQTMLAQQVPLPKPPRPDLYLIPLNDEARKVCVSLQKRLREGHVSVQMDYSGRKLNKIMGVASQMGATYTAVIGEDELKTQTASLKEMATGRELKVPFRNLTHILQVEAKSDEFTKLWQEMSQPFESTAEADFFIQKLHGAIQETTKMSQNLQSAIQKMKDILGE